MFLESFEARCWSILKYVANYRSAKYLRRMRWCLKGVMVKPNLGWLLLGCETTFFYPKKGRILWYGERWNVFVNLMELPVRICYQWVLLFLCILVYWALIFFFSGKLYILFSFLVNKNCISFFLFYSQWNRKYIYLCLSIIELIFGKKYLWKMNWFLPPTA